MRTDTSCDAEIDPFIQPTLDDEPRHYDTIGPYDTIGYIETVARMTAQTVDDVMRSHIEDRYRHRGVRLYSERDLSREDQMLIDIAWLLNRVKELEAGL